MSDNYILVSSPKLWASAHKPIRFVYDMPTETAGIGGIDGFVSVLLYDTFGGGAITVTAGDLVYIPTGVYKGYHVVKEIITSLIFTLETAYSVSDTVSIKYATPPQWQIWKGYQDSEVVGTNYFPFTKVADFAPEGNAEGYISFNVGGYVKSSMKPIEPPQEGTAFGSVSIYQDVSLWMPYRIFIGLNPDSLYFEQIYFALNSSIESDTLNAEYLNTGKPLNTLPFINSCGATWISALSSNGVTVYRFENGGALPSGGNFNNDFNNDFFNT